MALTRIHVNRHRINRNFVDHRNDPVFTVLHPDGRREHAHELTLDGPVRLVYRPEEPLADGAVVWLETEAEVQAGAGNG